MQLPGLWNQTPVKQNHQPLLQARAVKPDSELNKFPNPHARAVKPDSV